MAVSDFVKALEATNSRLDKEAIIRNAVDLSVHGDLDASRFLNCANSAYNPYRTWGVKKVDEISGQPTTDKTGWLDFDNLLVSLENRELTGNAARDAIVKLSKKFSDDDWNYVARRVLIKDLRCGVTATTINKFTAGTHFEIPGFGVQLATDSKGKPKKMTGIKRLEYKLDGVRMVALVKEGKVTLMSRNGKELENFPQIATVIQTISGRITHEFPNGFVLDGEVMGESFQALMKQAQRKRDVETENMYYNVFDIIDLTAFEQGSWDVSQTDRISILEDNRAILESTGVIRVSDGFNVDLDTQEGTDKLDDYFLWAIAEGYEGIMIKDIDASYQCKRTDAWLKLKPAITVDLTIISLEEGTGRNENRLGALVCEGEDEGKLIRVNVGSGLSDEQRDVFWTDATDVVGRVAEVMADAITQNQDGSYSLRFPRFVRFRGFEAGEKM